MAVTMKKEDQDALAAAGAKWNAAATQAEKDAAHAEAEAIRAKYNYSGGVDGSQHIPITTATNNTSGNSQYTAAGKGSDYYAGQTMSASDQALLKSYGDAYNNATTQAERDAAHAAAEALRSQYNYSGGADGSEFLVTPKQTTSFSYSSAPTYSDPYSKRIDQMLNDILNRDKFSYNAAEDDLYKQYKEQYTREGQRAMKDTMGQVSARTGGLASSYATSAAAQQNNYYMQQLSDKIPELYQMAYQMYLDDIDLQVQDLGLLEGASNTAYNRYRDTMADWRDDRDFAYGQYRDDVGDGQWQLNYNRDVFESDRDYDYGVGRDEINDGRYTDEKEYQKEQDANKTAYDRAMELLYAGVMPESSMLSAAGLTAAQANSLLETAKTASSSKTNDTPASYKPKLSASAVLDALENGVVNDEMRKAYKYYYGQDWASEADLAKSEEARFWDSMNKLGIGPVTANFVEELANAGGIVENEDGTVSWASGWNASNYEDKMKYAKKGNSDYLFQPDFSRFGI